MKLLMVLAALALPGCVVVVTPKPASPRPFVEPRPAVPPGNPCRVLRCREPIDTRKIA